MAVEPQVVKSAKKKSKPKSDVNVTSEKIDNSSLEDTSTPVKKSEKKSTDPIAPVIPSTKKKSKEKKIDESSLNNQTTPVNPENGQVTSEETSNSPATAKKTDVVKLDDGQIGEAVRAFKKLVEINSSEEKSDLFAHSSGEGQKIHLQIAGIKLPRVSESQILKFNLPHPHTADTRDVCLIVKDLQKGIRTDHEDTVRHFENLLSEKGVKGITKVLPLRELKVEYKTFEAKTSLCHLYDHFLADARIIRLLPQFLGKACYKRKKFPIQVNLTAKDLVSELARGINTVSLSLKHCGSSSAVTVGLTTTEDQHLQENLTNIVRALETKYPGGWVNIRSIRLFSGKSSLPLYVSLRSTEEVGMVRGLKRKVRGLVQDELSTVVGATVTVTPTGNVRVKRTKDPMWNEDEETQELTDQTTEKDGGETEIKKRKKDRISKAEVESDDEMEDKEMEYMQKVADEEEEMEKTLEASEDKLEEKLKCSEDVTNVNDSESDSEEGTEAVDDAAEAENLLSDGDDSDSEDELLMKNADFDDIEEEEEETPAKKMKTKKKKMKAKDTDKSTKEKTSTKKNKNVKEKPSTKQALKQKKKHLRRKTKM